MPDNDDSSITRARELRHNITRTEPRLWEKLRNRACDGWKFRRQVPIGPYFADFACHEAKLIVELDGTSHEHNQQHDATRTACLEQAGYAVIRFTNAEVQESPEGVFEAIRLACIR